MKKQYQIADSRLRISSDLIIQNDGWSAFFETADAEEEADFHIAIQVAGLPEYSEKKELYKGGKRKTAVYKRAGHILDVS